MTASALRAAAGCLLALPLLLLSGCGYTVHGKVVRGSFPSMSFVDPSDARLNAPPVPGVSVSVVRDADSLGARTVGSAVSDSNGMLEIPIDAAGAGVTDEEWMVRAMGGGYGSQALPLRFPFDSSKRVLLIVMTSGRSVPFERSSFDTTIDDALKQVEQYSR